MANIFVEAKKIQRTHKTWDWQKCIQAASKKHKPVKKKAVTKKRASVSGTKKKAVKVKKVTIKANTVKISGIGAVAGTAAEKYNQCVSGIGRIDNAITRNADKKEVAKLRMLRSGMVKQKNFFRRFL